jgi:hypothetical protein
MPEEIGLQELMYQVKKELLAPSPDDPVPLFYVEGVELELSVSSCGRCTVARRCGASWSRIRCWGRNCARSPRKGL